MNPYICRFALLATLLAPITLRSEVRLATPITDHAVLQRNSPIHIWGESSPSEKLTVTFHQQTLSTTANNLGLWELWLAPEAAGGPFTLNVQGSSTLSRTDILVGDVWVASGQSNMEMPLRGFAPDTQILNAESEIAHATQPQIRLLRIHQKSSDTPVADVDDAWTLCTPDTAKDFSAVAYFFSRDITQREHVPIGVIDSSWGGTPIESWISLEALASDASLMPAFASRARFANAQQHLDAAQAAEKRADAEALAANQPAPKHSWHPNPASWQPAALFNGMIAPLTPYTIKGFLWYQGETNSAPDRASLYVRLFPALIADWRQQWHQGDLPFLYAQISSFDSPGENWGTIRDAQRRTLSVINTGMAVTSDIGLRNNVHPPDKQTVGTRLSLAARALAYNEPTLEHDGPLFREATRRDTSVQIWFDHAAGLHSKGSIIGFELAGEDGRFSPAEATISGNTVLLSAPSIAHPMQVRYAWAGYTEAKLYNAANLPASTFLATVP